jgi:hypothetical protein
MWAQRTTYLYVILSLAGIAAILAGSQQSDTSMWRPILLELGVGALITTFLGLTVERIASERFRHEVNVALDRIKRNVFEETLHSMLPESVVSEVITNIFSQSLIRRNFQLLLTLERDSRLPEGMLKHSLSAAYELTNFAPHKISADIQDYVTLIPKPPEEWIVYEKVSLERDDGSVIELSDHDSQQSVWQEELAAGYHIPITLRPLESVRVQVCRNLVAYTRDHHTISMMMLTENFKLTINTPSELVVSATILHPSARSDSPVEQRRVKSLKGTGISTWEIAGGILPFQGIELMWIPRDALETTSNEATTAQVVV